jgi:hypothetical protein
MYVWFPHTFHFPLSCSLVFPIYVTKFLNILLYVSMGYVPSKRLQGFRDSQHRSSRGRGAMRVLLLVTAVLLASAASDASPGG